MSTRHYIAMFVDGSYHFLHGLFGWAGENATIDKAGWGDVRNEIAAALHSTSVYFGLEARVVIPITDAMKESAKRFLNLNSQG
ncbi:MAG: hypothetical protein P8P26_10070 [Porticoccaceae bacterium]|nr:hypothetical protein [Porticoccaceae bacterium]MDG1312389.1 hypothetical protein [Porticoccaceae bacterium]